MFFAVCMFFGFGESPFEVEEFRFLNKFAVCGKGSGAVTFSPKTDLIKFERIYSKELIWL